MSCSCLTNLSNSIFRDLGEPTSLSISSIQTKLISPAMVGQLNDLIGTCYTIESGCFVPELESEESAVYGLLYKHQYYQKAATQTLGAIGAVQWTEISEYDSTIRRASPNETSKVYLQIAKDTREEMYQLVDAYKRNLSNPNSVDYYYIQQYSPNPIDRTNRGIG